MKAIVVNQLKETEKKEDSEKKESAECSEKCKKEEEKPCPEQT